MERAIKIQRKGRVKGIMDKTVKCSCRTITKHGIEDVEFEFDFDNLEKFLSSVGILESCQSIKDELSTGNHSTVASLRCPISKIFLSVKEDE